MPQNLTPNDSPGVAVVIPCYRVIQHVGGVIASIGAEVERVYCVDDACPDGSAAWIAANIVDPRVCIIRNVANKGVGGAVLAGYAAAIADGMDIIVKVDGDGQMDPALIPSFVTPIANGDADYTKGNRFWDLREIRQMPLMRRIGNLGLSFLAKASSGYWDIFDPTNGYTAIHASVAARLPFESISPRYFFETDILFRLNTLRAVVVDVPMDARYGTEVSNLKAGRVLGEFLLKHARNAWKRVIYNYFLRDFSVASLELILGLAMLGFGMVFGMAHWWHSVAIGQSTPLGTVMIATIAIVSGLQFLLAFISYDVSTVPKRALHPLLKRRVAPLSAKGGGS